MGYGLVVFWAVLGLWAAGLAFGRTPVQQRYAVPAAPPAVSLRQRGLRILGSAAALAGLVAFLPAHARYGWVLGAVILAWDSGAFLVAARSRPAPRAAADDDSPPP